MSSSKAGPLLLVPVVSIALLVLRVLTGTLQAQTAPLVRAVGPIAITVSDLTRSVEFYTHVLDFKEISETSAGGAAYDRLEGLHGVRERTALLALGSEQILLTQYEAPVGRVFPSDSHSNDRWFQHLAIITSDMDRAYARLQADHVRSASTSPQRLPDSNPNAAGIRAFYFRDPDGHYLETLQFPPDKGDPKWHVANGALFLGIDHTAIVVHDTDASLAFYRDQLGFHVAGVSENYGIEQERLNNVPGAHLRITTMRAASGPGIEFLQYLQPSDGRAIPPDEQPDDLVYWQTTLVTSDLNAAGASLLQSGAFFVSNGIAVLRAQPDERAVVVRDPDGHALELLQRP